MTSLTKPVIIVGSGRCGSTVFQSLLASHPQVMWLSGLCDRYPTRPEVNRRVVSALGNPLVRGVLGRRIRPGECYRFWDRHTYGFSEPCRDLLAADVTPRAKKQVRAALQRMLTPVRNRLLLKITGWPRIGYLNEIFGDAKFIHILRDGRAVASSLVHVNFWRGWLGPQSWRAGLLTSEDEALWQRHERSFVALAALEWRIQMRAMAAARQTVDPARFHEVRYETFCERPLETYRQVLRFAELPEPPGLDRAIKAAGVRSTSNRWRDDLTPAQQGLLSDLLDEDLRRHGYDVAR